MQRASDLGVRKFLFSDQLFSFLHASYHFPQQDFHFDGIQQQALDIASIYPRGLLLESVMSDSVRCLVEELPFFTVEYAS